VSILFLLPDTALAYGQTAASHSILLNTRTPFKKTMFGGYSRGYGGFDDMFGGLGRGYDGDGPDRSSFKCVSDRARLSLQEVRAIYRSRARRPTYASARCRPNRSSLSTSQASTHRTARSATRSSASISCRTCGKTLTSSSRSTAARACRLFFCDSTRD
jgi:hypothetical protein